jgi:hypothetical protein
VVKVICYLYNVSCNKLIIIIVLNSVNYLELVLIGFGFNTYNNGCVFGITVN